MANEQKTNSQQNQQNQQNRPNQGGQQSGQQSGQQGNFRQGGSTPSERTDQSTKRDMDRDV